MAEQQFDVAYLAQLARVRLSPQEAELFQRQLADVLQHVQKLAEVDVSGIDVATNAVPMFNVFRDDETCDSFTAEEALRSAPRQANDLFIVTKVIE